MSDISPSMLGEKADAEFEKLVSECHTADEIKALYAEKAVRDGLVVRDRYDPSVLIPADRATAPTKVAKSITVEGGKKLFFEGDSDLDVERRITAYLQSQMRPVETQPEVQPRNEKGQFTRVDDPVAKVELELKFKRGEIDTETYLAESGAIDSYLASQGVSLDDLRKVANDSYQADWELATREFLERHPDWQGGAAALQETGETIMALHLQDSPSVESLEAAYQDMVRRNAVPANPELTAQREIHERISSANSVEEIRQAASSLFGRR